MLGWNDKYAEDCFPKDKLAQVKTFDFVVGVGGKKNDEKFMANIENPHILQHMQ